MIEGAEEWARESTYGMNPACNTSLPGIFCKESKGNDSHAIKIIETRNHRNVTYFIRQKGEEILLINTIIFKTIKNVLEFPLHGMKIYLRTRILRIYCSECSTQLIERSWKIYAFVSS